MRSVTSLNAYNTLKNKGFLTGLQSKVYNTLFNNGPLTQGEAWNEYLSEYQRHSIAPRFAELEKMGVIRTVGERPCRLTGVVALEWDVTDHVPESKPVRVPAKRLQDELPAILGLLAKLDLYFSALPEDAKQEVLHYDVNQLRECLK
jgi:hypothetical protein